MGVRLIIRTFHFRIKFLCLKGQGTTPYLQLVQAGLDLNGIARPFVTSEV